MKASAATLTAVVTVVCLTTAAPAVAQPEGAGGHGRSPLPGTSWRDVLDSAIAAAETTPFEAVMVVVTLEDDGPYLAEVELHHGGEGTLRVGTTDPWLIGNDRDGGAVFQGGGEGDMLRLGDVRPVGFDADVVASNYEVGIERPAELDTGTAVPVRFAHAGVVRERLYVDEATGLVVRRETYRRDGTPDRVVALTELQVVDGDVDVPADTGRAWSRRHAADGDDLARLRDEGWPSPDRLAGRFRLASALVADDGDSLHLVYSDGLYSLSLFEQPGKLDPGPLDGAVAVETDDAAVYRWPGAEPERVVWTGDGRTFTVVTDAPLETALRVVSDLPHDPPTPAMSRLGRGLKRLGGWLWPFD